MLRYTCGKVYDRLRSNLTFQPIQKVNTIDDKNTAVKCDGVRNTETTVLSILFKLITSTVKKITKRTTLYNAP